MTFSMASQAHVERLGAAGRRTLEAVREIVVTSYGDDLSKPELDKSLGRELGMALFVAAAGEGGVNRIWLIEGFLRAVGEAVAQQPPANAEMILAAVRDGLAQGQSFAGAAFASVGEA